MVTFTKEEWIAVLDELIESSRPPYHGAKISYSKIADEMGITGSALNQYRDTKNKRQTIPNLYSLHLMGKYFNVNITKFNFNGDLILMLFGIVLPPPTPSGIITTSGTTTSSSSSSATSPIPLSPSVKARRMAELNAEIDKWRARLKNPNFVLYLEKNQSITENAEVQKVVKEICDYYPTVFLTHHAYSDNKERNSQRFLKSLHREVQSDFIQKTETDPILSESINYMLYQGILDSLKKFDKGDSAYPIIQKLITQK